MCHDPLPDVTIGLAAYKCAATLERALDSLLRQTYPNFIIIVSDNCSPDGAGDICARYALQDSRVRHNKRADTVSVAENYRFLLAQAQTPYFMWAAADDLWAPSFLESNRAFLIENPDYVLSQSRVIFTSQGEPTRFAVGTYALRDSLTRNAAQFFRKPSDNSRFYGVWRTQNLRDSYPEEITYGFDWLISGVSLRYGKHNEIRTVDMVRDETPAPRYSESVAQYGGGAFSRFFPAFPLTRQILVKRLVPLKLAVLWALLQLNLSIALRFWTLRLYQIAMKHSEKPEATSIRSAKFAAYVSSILAPGMRERWSDRGARKIWRAGRVGLGKENQLRERMTHGWKLSRIGNRNLSGPDAGIVIIAEDALDDTLAALHLITAATSETTTEVIVVDNASLDATGLLLQARADLAYVRLAERLPFEDAVAAGVSRSSANGIMVVEPTAWLDTGSLDTFNMMLACLRSSKQPVSAEPTVGGGLRLLNSLNSTALGHHNPSAAGSSTSRHPCGPEN
jgi:glycosyltransferase involved in cell wall biosynthesis